MAACCCHYVAYCVVMQLKVTCDASLRYRWRREHFSLSPQRDVSLLPQRAALKGPLGLCNVVIIAVSRPRRLGNVVIIASTCQQAFMAWQCRHHCFDAGFLTGGFLMLASPCGGIPSYAANRCPMSLVALVVGRYSVLTLASWAQAYFLWARWWTLLIVRPLLFAARQGHLPSHWLTVIITPSLP